MNRERKAQIATILVLAGALTLVAAKRSGWRPAAIIQTAAPAVTGCGATSWRPRRRDWYPRHGR